MDKLCKVCNVKVVYNGVKCVKDKYSFAEFCKDVFAYFCESYVELRKVCTLLTSFCKLVQRFVKCRRVS